VIVVLLIVIWGVALVPVTMRWLSERQLATSVTRFMSARRNLRRTYPLLAVVGSEPAPGSQPERPRTAAQSDATRRLRREREQLLIERRRRALTVLLSGTGATVVFGAFPPLHMLWVASFVGLVLTGAYCAVLVRIKQREVVHLGGRRPMAPAATQISYEALLVANGQGQSVVAPRPPQRPAFVLVDAPS
jgi:hypothetical protein